MSLIKSDTSCLKFTNLDSVDSVESKHSVLISMVNKERHLIKIQILRVSDFNYK